MLIARIYEWVQMARDGQSPFDFCRQLVEYDGKFVEVGPTTTNNSFPGKT